MRNLITKLGFFLIKSVNKHKDTSLSLRLFSLAEDYNKRPGTLNYK